VNLKINWRYPKTELEYNFLSMLKWRVVYRLESDSGLFDRDLVKSIDVALDSMLSNCANCEYYAITYNYRSVDCDLCCLKVLISQSEYVSFGREDLRPCGYYAVYNSLPKNRREKAQYSYMIYKRLQNKVLELIEVEKKKLSGVQGLQYDSVIVDEATEYIK